MLHNTARWAKVANNAQLVRSLLRAWQHHHKPRHCNLQYLLAHVIRILSNILLGVASPTQKPSIPPRAIGTRVCDAPSVQSAEPGCRRHDPRPLKAWSTILNFLCFFLVVLLRKTSVCFLGFFCAYQRKPLFALWVRSEEDQTRPLANPRLT